MDRQDQPIHRAIKSGDVKEVRDILSNSKMNINSEDEYRRTPLELACMLGNLDIIKTLIDHTVQDDKGTIGDELLGIAFKNNIKDQEEVLLLLISKFGCNPTKKGMNGESLLHIACRKGYLNIIRTLIHDYHADLNDRVDYNEIHFTLALDNNGKTPFILALENERDKVMLVLISEFGYDPTNIQGDGGVSPLHVACKKGNLSLIRTLIRDYHADLNDKDCFGEKSLTLALDNERDEVMLALISEFGYDPSNIKWSLLLMACKKGNFSLLKTLVYDYHMDLNDKDCLSFKMALENERDEIALGLFDYDYDPKAKDECGRSLLHIACEKGRLCVVRTLVLNHHLELHDQDSDGNTPLVLATENGSEEVVLALINEFGCDPKNRDLKGRSLLHVALYGGWYGLFKTLVNNFNFDLNGQDDCHETPLTLGMKHEREIRGISLESPSTKFIHSLLKELLLYGKLQHDSPLGAIQPKQLVSSMLRQFNIDPNLKDFEGGTLLHLACREGRIDVMHTLIQTFKTELNIRDDHNDTPLMKAVEYGRCETVKSLISDYGSDINVTASNGWSLLHIAVSEGHTEMLKLLVSKFGMSLLVVDEAGDTPLHVCAKLGHYDCVRSLLEDFQSPIYTRNRAGKTPIDVAWGIVKRLFDHYLSHSSQTIQADYQSMQQLAEKKFSGSHHITKLFVVGHPGAGKSSLVEALKREGFFVSFFRVSEKSVPPHTAGIVPSIHTSPSYGRVQFYDFAGDPEYYSSHAAILEKIFQSKIGTTICIIVLDLREDDEEIEKKFLYWSIFICNSSKDPQNLPSLLVIGSHSDLLPNQREVRTKNDFIQSMISKYDKESVYFSLDCCYPRSDNLYALRKHIKTISEKSKPCSLSQEMSVLLGLLEKDFQSVTACTAHVLVHHINLVGLCLPKFMTHLHPLLLQLQDIGELLIVGGEEDDSYLILNVSQLTNEVHKKLFSKEPDSFPRKPDDLLFNIGLLPESILQEILPEHITRECLIQLQYCQEISPVEIDLDYSILPSPDPRNKTTSPNQSLLFFPALCTIGRRDISWLIPPASYSIGWLARCSRPHDYFPPRFLHVLLLRIALRFTVLAPNPHAHHALDIRPVCKMWKTGVHWLMEEGVECTVELVDVSKSVVVVLRGKKRQNYEKYGKIMCSIVSCVMEAKTEFCHSIQPDFFLLDSTDEDNYLNEDNFFSMYFVERVLMSPEGKEDVINTSNKTMSCEKVMYMRQLTYWSSLFPIDFPPVYQLLEGVSAKWYVLGLHLHLPKNKLDVIEEENPKSVENCLRGMVSAWMHFFSDPPCWWHLILALREIGKGGLTTEVESKYGEFISCS